MSQYSKALLDLHKVPAGQNVSVTNHPTSIEVSNHPTSIEVSNHPTSIGVSNHPTSIEVSNFPTNQQVSGSVSVSNHPTSIEVSNFPVSQPVTGTFFQATQPVSGSVTVSNHPTSIEVSNFPTNQQVSGSVSVSNHPTSIEVSNFPVSQPVTGTFFQATQPVSGSVTVSNHPTSIEVSNFPATQAISGSVTVSNFPATQSVSVSNPITGYALESSLSSVDGKISTGSADVASGTDIQQVLCYGKDASNVKHALDVDSQGHLKTTQQDREIQRQTTTITTDFSDVALGTSITDTQKSKYWDAESYDKFLLFIDGTSGSFSNLRLQASESTTDGDFVDIEELYETQAGTSYFYRYSTSSAHQRYYRLVNSSGATITFGNIKIHFLK